MRRFRIVECARLASVKGCTTVQKRGVARSTDIKKMASPLKRERAQLSFSPERHATTVKRRNFRNSTSRRLFLTLRHAVTLPESYKEKGRRMGRSSRPFSVNFLRLMKEHTHLTPKHTQSSILAHNVVEQPPGLSNFDNIEEEAAHPA